jgi:hypothetical protein
VILGLTLKQFALTSTKAEAETPPITMNVTQMHRDHAAMQGMKVDRIHDMQTVFTDQE